MIEENIPIQLPGEKLRTIMAALALAPGTPVPALDLLDELWGDQPPKTADNSLQSHVARLRRVLTEQTGKPKTRHVIRTTRSGYLLDVDPADVDALRFSNAVEAAGRRLNADCELAIKLLTDAFSEWRGPALIDTGDGLICRIAYTRLEETRLMGRELFVEAHLRLGRYWQVIPELEQLLTQHPLRERFCEQLMTALYHSGRQADALSAYRRVQHNLDAELGIEPGPGMQRRFRQILHQEGALLRGA
ncbi:MULTISPECIES: BTAD domain-containing putative transcriptional regulator [unclassified Streptomyces]|uniref:AfsR/SARP family transcriptional regulator n=2 Tax=Streptomyces TaxID=1883 RepID=UPI002E1966CB|nr:MULTISPECIES: BTAD domain-containing putative transcriptional regulator [unclassified Streptomyces]